MARLPRLTIADLPHHIIQLGNNGADIFIDAQDRETMLGLLREMARSCELAVHAYVLLPSQFHLLATPRTDDGLPRFMQAVGRRYVRYFNDRHGRSGTLWEGRYRSAPLEGTAYLLPCLVWLDTHPQCSGLTTEPGGYTWSSHGHYVGQRMDRLITPPDVYWALGNTPFAREAAYADMVRTGVSASQQAALTESALSGWALGDADFLGDLQKRTERRVVKARVGRPTRKPGTP